MPFNPTLFKVKTIKGTTVTATKTKKHLEIYRTFKTITADAAKGTWEEDNSDEIIGECNKKEESLSISAYGAS